MFLAVFYLAISNAQKKQITVEEIYGDTFSTKGMEALNSMKDGKHYTILNLNQDTKKTSIDT